MNDKKKPRITDVPLSESTVAVSLSAIRRRCEDLLNAQGEIQLSIDDSSGSRKLPDGAMDPYDNGA
ncbi:MAG: hypothetical protein WBN32_12965 [Woeseia sp.]